MQNHLGHLEEGLVNSGIGFLKQQLLVSQSTIATNRNNLWHLILTYHTLPKFTLSLKICVSLGCQSHGFTLWA